MSPWGSSFGPGAFCEETPPAQASLASPVDAEPQVESWVLSLWGSLCGNLAWSWSSSALTMCPETC